MLSEKWRISAIVGTRVIELICIAFTISGFLWATSDLLLIHILVESPVAPLSVLFMLYGTMGTVVSEAIARWLGRRNNQSAKN